MTAPIRFCLVLHNHQPVGNFDDVFEQAYRESYQPFLDVFEPFTDLRLSLHTSGPLMEWLADNHPEYLDRLAQLVAAGRIEILGGPFYEPILTMIPQGDRQGQIAAYTQWLGRRLGADVRGMWVPERVWESALTYDLAGAGMEYTVLDDFHFRNAGCRPTQLNGYYVTEDQGRTLKVFPGSERLRYLIPFAEPEATRDFLGEWHGRCPGAVAVFADDGEKFGTWPDTYQHVYTNGWLRRFLTMLCDNRHWIQTVTLSEAVRDTQPCGKIYLPDASYREMTEWALPVERQLELESLKHEFTHDPRWERIQSFIRGGLWRNFKVKYPESNEMYARMLEVSRRCAKLEHPLHPSAQAAKQALYRGQCNCSYWHGAFGGIYLPHLRHAVYAELIEAENQLDLVQGPSRPRLEAIAEDWDFDGLQEVKLSNDYLAAYFAPARGGVLYELDLRRARHNVLATLARRPEAYHQKVKQGPSDSGDHVASIHDRVVFKQAGLDKQLFYDPYPRKSLIDHFFPAEGVTPEELMTLSAPEIGDFVERAYETTLHRDDDRVHIRMQTTGNVDGHAVTVTKGVTMRIGSPSLEVAYLLEGLPPQTPWRFASEWGFSGLPANAEGRYFFGENRQPLGDLGTLLHLREVDSLGMADEWLGIEIDFQLPEKAAFWTFPIQTVSQSEGGFELVHQSVTVVPHWRVIPDSAGRWSVVFRLNTRCRSAEESAAVDEHPTVSTTS